MMIVSFAWTVDALLAGCKTITRRDWLDDYARKFRNGDRVQAYDKSPRSGGQCRAIIRVENLRREPLSRLIDEPEYGCEELAKEGGLWVSVGEFVGQFSKLRHGHPYRVQFRLEETVSASLHCP